MCFGLRGENVIKKPAPTYAKMDSWITQKQKQNTETN
jgi:hypothetical protein